MILKVTRGNDFAGAIDYIARLGVYARKGMARIMAMDGLYDLRTAAAQLAYDAALDPARSRPVVHLIARAEKGLNDEQYTQLINRMLKAAGLQGHRFVAAVHDDDDHLHVVVSEVNEDGGVPPRILWHRGEKRVVSADEAKSLPRGMVAGRAWDSHLAWRLTRVAREVEVAWDLRRLSSSSKANAPVEPRCEQWQKERLARIGKVPLQDRYWNEIRVALALPTWNVRAAALDAHGLVMRAHEVGGRVRGLQVQSLSDAQDFVKISAFEMGGMPKLDASADQPFLAWAAQERHAAISLTKPATSQHPDMIAMQAAFKAHQKDWRRRDSARIGAYHQRRRDTAAIEADMADFADRFRPILTVRAFRQARAEKRRGLKALADARLADALATAGPQMPQPVFVDFVKARAGAGDVPAARVYRDIVGDVSETRRRSLDRITAMAEELAAAARALRERRERVRAQIAVATVALRKTADQLAKDAAADTLRLKAAMQSAAHNMRARLTLLAERLAHRLDAAGYRIRITDTVHVDRWQLGQDEREILEAPANRHVFEPYARVQMQQVQALCDDVRRMGAVRRAGTTIVFDPARSDIGNAQVLRWANEPEVFAALYDIDLHRRAAEARTERTLAARRQQEAAAALDQIRSTSAAHFAALAAWAVEEGASELRRASAAIRIRAAELAASEAALRESAAVDRAADDRRAGDVLAQVLADPQLRKIRDEKAADLAERQDRQEIGARLDRQKPHFSFEERWIDLWRDILDERPLDTTVAPAERNRAIDHEVAAAMMHEGATLMQTRSAIMQFSPTVWALKSRQRLAYVDEQIDALDYVLRRMTPKQREMAGPKPVSAVDLANMAALTRDPYDESLDDHFNWVAGELPLRPRPIAHIAKNAEGRANIYGVEVHFAVPDATPVADHDREEPATIPVAQEPLFDAVGQPLPHVRAILDGIRQHRAAFNLVEGRLTAPGQPAEHQRLLVDLLADPRFEQLALAAYRGSGGVAGVTAAIGDASQR